ncbi:TspO/MBR family protein [Natrialba asiatica]|uniref:TspO and MBR like protein n=1 Tax=Natrialba asiatica (strain ATCC 700177 / DSM 12278 / JCM 9576 / FERM P-10747 / NBRC 102637 / 172P1) TaxID=29540 RepID=M0AWI1_NATA1|nr:TspO/MBR family protein [Natrialba asiatica]ELZ02333.1 TspO and MBR like protein [Natrialba asiatica DSM 12278]
MDTMSRPGTSSIRDGLVALGLVLGVNALGASPAVFISSDTAWIDRPWFYPPEIAFPIVWTLLFTLMGVALFLVWRRTRELGPGRRRDLGVALGAFVVQFALNFAWTPVFFGLRRPDLGLVVIGALWIAVVGTIVAFARLDRLAAGLLVPYLGWVSFAFALNYAIYAAG